MEHSTGRTVTKNASWLMVSQFLTWGLSILLTVFFSRYLAAEGIGKLHLANSLWAIASIFATFGLDILLTKELARFPEKTDSLLGTSLVLRTLLFLITSLGMALYVQHAGYPLETLYVIAILGLTNLLSQYAASVEAILRGLERMEFVSIGTVVLRATWVAAAVSLLLLGYGVVVVVSASIVTTSIHLFLLLYFVNRVRRIHFSFDRTTAWWMLKSGYVYLFVYVFLVLYAQIDTIVISLLVDERTIGWYAVADQLFGTLLFIPTVFLAAVFPAMSRMHNEASPSGSRLMSKGFDMLLLLGVPIGLGLVVIADQVVRLLFGADFAASGPVLAIRGIVLIMTYQNILLGQYYISIDRPRFWTWVMVVATLATIPLDIIIIPWCAQTFGNGAIGGALAYVVTELGMMVIGVAYLPKGILRGETWWLAARIVAAGVVMAGVTWLVHGYFIAIPIVVGAIVYITLILLFRVVPAEDLVLLKQLSQQTMSRLRSRSPQPVNS